MKFEWDEAKNQRNIIKHNISFEEAGSVFTGIVLTKVDYSRYYSEERYRTIGRLLPAEDCLVIVVVHTKRGERTRLISARRANRSERKKYYDYIQRQST